MTQPKFPLRSDEDYHEYSLAYCGKIIASFKKLHFRKKAKPSRIYGKVFFPPDCPEQFWMYYLVFEVSGKTHSVYPVSVEAFDVLTRGIEPDTYMSVEFYTIETHDLAAAE